MIALSRKADNSSLGDISEEELQFLIDNLEEDEGLGDTEYNITRLTLQYLRENGISAHLASVLESALGDKDEVDIVYQPQ
jgi:processive 1,2-diacylglycerol beta-glucosyltransferase